MLDPAGEDEGLERPGSWGSPAMTSAWIPSSTRTICSCGWLWSGTVAPGSKRIRFSIAPSPKSGRPLTPAASSNARDCVEPRTNLRLHVLDYRSSP